MIDDLVYRRNYLVNPVLIYIIQIEVAAQHSKHTRVLKLLPRQEHGASGVRRHERGDGFAQHPKKPGIYEFLRNMEFVMSVNMPIQV